MPWLPCSKTKNKRTYWFTKQGEADSEGGEVTHLDSESLAVVKLLAELASADLKFAEFSRALRSRNGVSRVLHQIETKGYEGDYFILEGYVDAEFETGKGIAWLINVRIDGQEWLISSSIRQNSTGEQEMLREFLDRTSVTFDDFLADLDRVDGELLTTDGIPI